MRAAGGSARPPEPPPIKNEESNFLHTSDNAMFNMIFSDYYSSTFGGISHARQHDIALSICWKNGCKDVPGTTLRPCQACRSQTYHSATIHHIVNSNSYGTHNVEKKVCSFPVLRGKICERPLSTVGTAAPFSACPYPKNGPRKMTPSKTYPCPLPRPAVAITLLALPSQRPDGGFPII